MSCRRKKSFCSPGRRSSSSARRVHRGTRLPPGKTGRAAVTPSQRVGAGASDTARVPLPLPAAASLSRPPPHTSTNEHGKALLERGARGWRGQKRPLTIHPAASGSRGPPSPRAAPAPPRSPVTAGGSPAHLAINLERYTEREPLCVGPLWQAYHACFCSESPGRGRALPQGLSGVRRAPRALAPVSPLGDRPRPEPGAELLWPVPPGAQHAASRPPPLTMVQLQRSVEA